MADRYWAPTSGPCRLRVVGSWMSQKTSRSSSYETWDGSKTTRTTSACPVRPEPRPLYVGFLSSPPLYPTSVDCTPLTLRNAASTPQKQPAPNVAFSVMVQPPHALRL